MRLRRTLLEVAMIAVACLSVPGYAYADKAQQLKVGRAANAAAAVTAGPFNEYLVAQVSDAGRFNVGAYPDPDDGQPQADSYMLTYAWPGAPSTSYSTIRIDGTDHVFGTDGTQRLAPTNVNPQANMSTWSYGDIWVTQTLELKQNNLTSRADALSVRYTVVNRGATPRAVGARAMFDTDVNGNDSAPFRIPGVGPSTTEQNFTGNAVPQAVQVFYDLSDATHIGAATFRGLDGPDPDRVAITNWADIYTSVWEYTTTAGRQTGDSAYATWWDPTALAPGSSRTYETVIGLASVTVDLSPPIGLGVTAPAALGIDRAWYSPDPFDVTATVLNNSGAMATNVRATIRVHDDLAVQSGPSTIGLGNMNANSEQVAFWQVQVRRNNVQGEMRSRDLTYSVTVTADNAPAKTVTRTIRLPAVRVNGTYGGRWPFNGTQLTLYWDYGGQHRYLGNAHQGAANWNAALSWMNLQKWPGIPYKLDIPFNDYYERSDTAGYTFLACATCVPYTRNPIYLNQYFFDDRKYMNGDDQWRTKTATHELGHALGLQHPWMATNPIPDSVASIMKWGKLPYNTPQQTDISRLTDLYR
jgi:hypothetical protein